MVKDGISSREDIAEGEPTIVSEAELGWPTNQNGWIFLGRTVQLYGAYKFGPTWTGKAVKPRIRRLPLPAFDERWLPRWREARLRAHRLLTEHKADYVARPSVPPPPRPYIFPVEIPRQQDFEFSAGQWEDARSFDRQQIQAERSREECLTAVYRDLRDAFLVGKVGTGSLENDGTFIELPLEIWALPDPDIFEAFHSNKVPSQSRNRGRQRQWIFVAEQDFSAFLPPDLKAGSLPQPAVNMHLTGAPGRPTVMPYVVDEFERRCTLNEIATTLADEARSLHAWAAAKYIIAPAPKTIENRIRERFREHRIASVKS